MSLVQLAHRCLDIHSSYSSKVMGFICELEGALLQNPDMVRLGRRMADDAVIQGAQVISHKYSPVLRVVPMCPAMWQELHEYFTEQFVR